jgi:hypothetical protein
MRKAWFAQVEKNHPSGYKATLNEGREEFTGEYSYFRVFLSNKKEVLRFLQFLAQGGLFAWDD